MREPDFDQFGQMLDAVCSLLSRGSYQPSPQNTALWFRALARFDLADVRMAFDAHVADPQRGRFVPVPADLIAQLEQCAEGDGRPGPEEAWAQALRARSEWATVVWTPEMSAAWNIAKPVFELGDEVGARMAFREAYSRLVDEARKDRVPVRWDVSLGFDPEGRGDVIGSAIVDGRLLERDARLHGALIGFEGQADASPPPVDVLRKLADSIRAQRMDMGLDTSERDRTAALKAASAKQVEGFASANDLLVQAPLPVPAERLEDVLADAGLPMPGAGDPLEPRDVRARARPPETTGTGAA
jgi:hypothetical protein